MKIIENKTKKMLQVEKKFNKNIEEVLRSRFVDKNMPIMAIGEELGISYRIVLNWLKLAGVYSRNLELGYKE